MQEYLFDDIRIPVPAYLQYAVDTLYSPFHTTSGSASLFKDKDSVRFYFTLSTHAIRIDKPGVYTELPPKIDDDNYTAEYASKNPSLYRTEIAFKTATDPSLDSSVPVVFHEYSNLQKNIIVTARNPHSFPHSTSFIPVPEASARTAASASENSFTSPDFSIPLLIDQWLMALSHAPITHGFSHPVGTVAEAHTELERVATQLRDILLAYLLPLGRPHAAQTFCRLFKMKLWARDVAGEAVVLHEVQLSSTHVDITLPGFSCDLTEASSSMISELYEKYPEMRESVRVPMLLERNAWGYVLVAWEDKAKSAYPPQYQSTLTEISPVTVPAGYYLLCVRPRGRIPPHRHEIMSETEMPLHGHLLCCGEANITDAAITDTSITETSISSGASADLSGQGKGLKRGLGGCGVMCAWGREPHAHANVSERAWACVACIDAPKFVPGDEIILAQEDRSELKPLLAQRSLWLARARGKYVSVSSSASVASDSVWCNVAESPVENCFGEVSETSTRQTVHSEVSSLPFRKLTLPGGLPNQTLVVAGSDTSSTGHESADAVLCPVLIVSTPEARQALIDHLQHRGLKAHAHGDASSVLRGLQEVSLYMVEHRKRGWEIPGGKIDENETPEAAAAREFEEEVGAVIDSGVFPLDKMTWQCLFEYVIAQHDGEKSLAMREQLNVNVGDSHVKRVMLGILVDENSSSSSAKLRDLQNETVRAGKLPLMTIPAHSPSIACCGTHAQSSAARVETHIPAKTYVDQCVCMGGKTSPLLQDQVWNIVVRHLQVIVANTQMIYSTMSRME